MEKIPTSGPMLTGSSTARRDMPVPMPGDGSQLVALSHVDDVALMCAAIGKEAGVYNQLQAGVCFKPGQDSDHRELRSEGTRQRAR